ncbi:hypothetical protein Trydic_g16978 [Trypoxylus dichotomus]
MESEVPQLSVLGPMPFTIYIADIPKCKDHRVFNAIYADNTAIVTTSRHSKISLRVAQVYLPKLRGKRPRSLGSSRDAIKDESGD